MIALSVEDIEKCIADSYELSNNVLQKIPEPLVSVRTSTYNHGKYIKYCIEGVLMQKTTFPFEFIIGEDCSTDGTREIVFEYAKKYPDIIRVITADYNVGSKANGRRCIRACRGKYMAICEGDDYWTDPLKLQKQVDFLEANPEYGLVHTNFDFVDIQNCKLPIPEIPLYKNMNKRIFNGYIWDYFLVNPGFILTCTICFRRDLLRDDEVRYYDHGLFLMLSRQAKVYYLPDITSAYRRNPCGIMMSTPKAVSDKMGLTLLFQLYYYYTRPEQCADYYKHSFKSHLRMLECYANILLRFKKNVFCEYRKMFYLIYRNPLYLLALPYFIVVVIIRKKLRAC